MRSYIDEANMVKINMRGIESNEESFLYGEFRQPGALTNDLVNNKEFSNGKEETISMGHLKRIQKD